MKETLDPNVGVTLFTGMRGCGKTALTKLLERLAHNETMIAQDTSSIIDLHIACPKSAIGKELAAYTADKNSGRILPCELAFKAVQQWLDAKIELQRIKHLLLAGSPRGKKQSELWYQFGKSAVRVVHIVMDPEEVLARVAERQKKDGYVRPDETPEALKIAIKEYQEKVVPGLEIFNGSVLHLPRSLPMRTRLERVIGHADVPPHVRRHLKQRLDTPNHPVSIEVDQLDGVNRGRKR